MAEPLVSLAIVHLDAAIKHLCREDLKSCLALSRAEIADRLSAVLEIHVTPTMINSMVADSHANRLPAAWIPAWTKVTGSTRIIAYLCQQSGNPIAPAEDGRFAKLGRAYLTRRRAKREMSTLERELEGKQ